MTAQARVLVSLPSALLGGWLSAGHTPSLGHLSLFGPLTGGILETSNPLPVSGQSISEQQEVARPFGKFGDCGHSSRQIVGSDAGYWTGDRAGSLEAWGGVSRNVTSCSAPEDWLIWLVIVWLLSQVALELGSPGSIGGPQGPDSLPEVSVRSQKEKVQPKAPT